MLIILQNNIIYNNIWYCYLQTAPDLSHEYQDISFYCIDTPIFLKFVQHRSDYKKFYFLPQVE